MAPLQVLSGEEEWHIFSPKQIVSRRKLLEQLVASLGVFLGLAEINVLDLRWLIS